MTSDLYLTAGLSVSVSFVLIMWRIWWRPLRMQFHGVDAVGEVIEIRETEVVDSETDERHWKYVVHDRFQAASGQLITGRATLKHGTTLRVGSRVTLRYLPGHPSRAELVLFREPPPNLVADFAEKAGVAAIIAYHLTDFVASRHGIVLCEMLRIPCLSDVY